VDSSKRSRSLPLRWHPPLFVPSPALTDGKNSNIPELFAHMFLEKGDCCGWWLSEEKHAKI